MQEYVCNNKYSLLNIKIKYNCLLLISFILISVIITASIYIKTYDSYKFVGTFYDNQIILNVNSGDINRILNSNFLKINDKKSKFSILSVGDLQYDEATLTNYQTVIISTSNSFTDNLRLEVTFYGNKQRIITKLINLLK